MPRPSESSVMIPTSSFSWCTGHQGCALSPRFKWRCLGHQRNCSAVRPQKVQSASRYPRTVRLRYSVVLLWKKGKRSALKLLEIDIPGLDQVLGQPGATHAQLQETAYTFFLPLYGQKGCTTMNDARAHFYRGHKKPLP